MKPILIMSILFLYSCQSQSNFDLTNIKLNKDKVMEIIPKDVDSKTFDAGLSGGDNKFTSIKSEKILIFNKESFAGKNSKAYSANSVFLMFNKKDSIVTSYTLHVFIEKQGEKLLKTLNNKLGNPNYTGYSLAEDKVNNNPSVFMWEDKKDNTFYHIQYTKQNYGMEATLNVMPIKKVYPGLPGITYWESFTYERDKRKDTNYTYQQFIIDETEKDSENFYNILSK